MSKVTEKYFLILKDYFGPLRDWASRKGYSGSEALKGAMELYSPALMKTTLESLHQELMSLEWSSQETDVAKIGGLKTSYLGQMYAYLSNPTSTIDFLKKTCMYSDTIIINDSILSELLTWRKRGTGELISFNLVALWALHLLSIEDLFSSELDPPICVLAPCAVVSLEKRNILASTDRFINENTVTSYASDLFERNFASHQDLMIFLSKIKDFNEFASLVRKRDMLTKPGGEPVAENDYWKVREYYESKYNELFSLPDSFWLLLRGRYTMPAYDLVVSGKLASSFATDFPGVWNALLWLIKNDNRLIFDHLKKKPLSKDTLIMNALQQEELKWMGNIPLDKIKELRVRGELQEIRDILGRNIEDIANVNDEEFVDVGRQVKYNIEEAFKKHDAEVKDLDEKYKRRYKIDAVTIVAGNLGMVAALYPPFVLAASVASGIIGGGSVIDALRSYLEKRDQLQALRRKPVAMLFDSHKTAKG
jgi:hypothetical protein